MIGSVAQIVALVSHGNHFLRSGKVDHFHPDNSTFQFCNNVDFRLQTHRRLFIGESISVIANDPQIWFQYLRETKCDRLNFSYRHSDRNGSLGDHNLTGLVGGGGEWSIEAIYGKSCAQWGSYWQVTDRKRSDQKIWTITYFSDGSRREPAPFNSIHSSRETIVQALNEIIDFANTQSETAFIPYFEKALRSLDSNEPEGDFYHRDLLIGPITLETRQLFYAAAHAWVFGGMGWWNDRYFEDSETQKSFESITAGLYDAINDAYSAALNN